MEKIPSPPLPLNLRHVQKPEMIINRLYMFFLGIALFALFYYRATDLSRILVTEQRARLLPYLLVSISELLFAFHWALHQAFRLRPISRTVHPERLLDELPPIDVFVCTADPEKEPPLSVMNTVISAMALDYPPDKLSVYLSDDGGSFVTLRAMKEALRFSKWWLPFCRKYEVENRCPGAYFSTGGREVEFVGSSEFIAEEMEIKKRYDAFKVAVEKISANASSSVSRDHKPTVEVLNDTDGEVMPLLVYVAREKRPSQQHHFKAGALNALIRVSAVISNAPYILVLDCDHYCNDPTSARQAMCFFLDPQSSSRIAWINFPQKFHNTSDHDIYDGRLYYYWRRWIGLDGIEGPFITGTNLYLKREALYGKENARNGTIDFDGMKQSFGPSNELVKSIHKTKKLHLSNELLENEVHLVASCTYERHSKWGEEVGFLYASMVEDVVTGLHLHSQGWTSVYMDPPTPCFLGSCPTNLSDTLVQQSRWGLGQLQISLSKYCPFSYGREKMSTLQRMCYAATTFDPITVVPFYGLTVIPQVSLVNGVSLYPKVSDPFALVFVFIFVASQLKHAQEVVFFGDSIVTALYELRFWMMRSASSFLYSTSGALLNKVGLQEPRFNLTDKVVDDEQVERFKKGVYDFRGSGAVIAPICSLYILNLASFVFGVARIVKRGEANDVVVQGLIPLFGIVVNYHVFEGMVMRKDEGRVSSRVALVSLAIATFVLWKPMAEPPNALRVLRKNLIINRLHMFLNAIAISAVFYYRATALARIFHTGESPFVPYLLVFGSEILLTFLWVLHQAYRWRPVKRTVYPWRLPEDDKLPPVDVFICTADPSKEPSLGVMNTVISAMALDYPPDKLAVYLQDDGGSHVTLQAMREAWKFGRYWIPFCRKHELNFRCPEPYFAGKENGSQKLTGSSEFDADRKIVAKKYEEFQEAIEKNSVNAKGSVSRDHSPTIEVMTDDNKDPSLKEMPLLVYVSREKRPGQPHHFKGGALNVLLRVSALISNAPYFLVLDCDMYCGDPSSARQAMCFYLDPKLSSKIAWVQYPQKFRDASEHDIYDGRLSPIWREGQGLDGLRGPAIYGCNFFMTREAIYATDRTLKDIDLNQLKKSFGPSNEFIKSINRSYNPQLSEDRKPSGEMEKELQLVASCTYDIDTRWGEEVGYKYFTVVEDSITSIELHCKGWISVLLDPERPCFLGSCTSSLNDMLVQQTRWSFGLMQIGLSKYMPLIYGPLRMSILQSMCYGALVLDCLYAVAFFCLAIIPPICLLHGIPLYPKVSDPMFLVFAFIFISSQIKHLQEVVSYGDSAMTALYELRVWMMKCGACYFFAIVNAVLDKLGLLQANFSLTNKAVGEEQAWRLQLGIYDFQVEPLLLTPMCSLYVLNLTSFAVGVSKVFNGSDELLGQVVLSSFGVIVNFHLLQGMFLRMDNGRVSVFVTMISVAISAVVLGSEFLVSLVYGT